MKNILLMLCCAALLVSCMHRKPKTAPGVVLPQETEVAEESTVIVDTTHLDVLPAPTAATATTISRIVNDTPTDWYTPASSYTLDLDNVGYFTNTASTPRLVNRAVPSEFTVVLRNPANQTAKHPYWSVCDFAVLASNNKGAPYGAAYSVWVSNALGDSMQLLHKRTTGSGGNLFLPDSGKVLSGTGLLVIFQMATNPGDGDYVLHVKQSTASVDIVHRTERSVILDTRGRVIKTTETKYVWTCPQFTVHMAGLFFEEGSYFDN